MIKRFMDKKSLSVRESAETLKKITSGNTPKIKKTADKKQVDFEALNKAAIDKITKKKPVAGQKSLFEEAVAQKPVTQPPANDITADNKNVTSAAPAIEKSAKDAVTKENNVQESFIEAINDEQVAKEVKKQEKKPFLKAVTSITSEEKEDTPKNEKPEETHDEPPQIIKFESLKKQDSSKENVYSMGKKSEEKKKPKKPKLIATNPKKGLHICNLGKSYGDKPAVRDVSMVLNRGEAVGLLGPNGAGKTTSFYMIMGLIRPDYGTISLDGTDITNLPVYRRARMGIGYLPQEASIFRGMTVEENILSVLEISEPVSEKRSAELDSLLGEFSITHLRRSPAIALSGGERRRVEIARALASNPSFILLDEPLAGIDPVAVADIKELISHLKNRGIGVLITDHNVREALDLINRAYIIHDGKVLMEGTPAEIVGNKEVRRVYLGDKFSL